LPAVATDDTADLALAELRRAPMLVRPSLKFALTATVAFGIGFSAIEAGLIPRLGGTLVPTPPTLIRLNRPVVAPSNDQALAVTVRPNDTLDGIFRRLKLSVEDLAVVRNLPNIRQRLDFLHPGDVIKLNLLNGSLSSLERRVNDRQTLTVARSPQGEFAAHIVENALDIRQAPLHAEISSSLFRSVNEAGAGDAVAAQLVDVFRYDIDFAQELQPGDTFTVVLEKVYRDGKFLHDGDILAAEFVNSGKTYRAVRYTTPDGHSDYYTPDGKSLRKAFLRAPVEFSRISSGFGLRWHPILNHMRAHKGIDYAAPAGTPIHAAGDGRVTFRGTQNGYGNVIVLAHSGDVQTLYGHMSRFGAGMAVGRHVHQGELIGYVGQSGLATGPHLHYEYRVHGEHRNPAGIKSIPTEPIEAGQRAAFDARAKQLLADLDAARNSTHLAAR
jgi:murein DD-endopeptidase MepM/ murein hydrolase activator NlpD